MARQSDRFYETISGSHKIVSWVDAIGPNQQMVRLPAVDGQVDVDGTAQFRRKISLQCIDPTGEFVPRSDGDLLTPYGTELRPYRGVQYTPDPADVEICPLGVFRITKATVNDSNGGSPTISIEGLDRSWAVSRDKFKTPYVIAAGTNALTAIKSIVEMTYPDCQYDTVTTAVSTVSPLMYDAGSDPWEAVNELAASMGCQVYFNVQGRLAVLPPYDINALPSPDFTYMEGQRCVMLDLSREYNSDGVYNGVIVTGESIGDSLPPVRGEAWDVNPTSPTYRLGPYGEVPVFITDKLAKTEDQATAIAQSILSRILGASQRIGITGIVNPSYEVNDIVRVRRQRAAVDATFALDAFSIPLRGHTQSLSLREQRPSP